MPPGRPKKKQYSGNPHPCYENPHLGWGCRPWCRVEMNLLPAAECVDDVEIWIRGRGEVYFHVNVEGHYENDKFVGYDECCCIEVRSHQHKLNQYGQSVPVVWLHARTWEKTFDEITPLELSKDFEKKFNRQLKAHLKKMRDTSD